MNFPPRDENYASSLLSFFSLKFLLDGIVAESLTTELLLAINCQETTYVLSKAAEPGFLILCTIKNLFLLHVWFIFVGILPIVNF